MKYALIIFLLFSFVGTSQHLNFTSVSEDFKEVKNILNQYHPNPWIRITENDWDSKCDSILTSLSKSENRSIGEFYSNLTFLLNLIRDEHTGAYLPDSTYENVITGGYFPFKIIHQNNSLLLGEHLLGQKNDNRNSLVSSINNIHADTLIEKAKKYWIPSASSNYEGTLYHAFNHDNFSKFFKLFVDQSDCFEIILESGDTLKTMGIELNSKRFNTVNNEHLPELTIDDKNKTAVLKIDCFMPSAYGSSLRKSKTQLKAFFKKIESAQVEELTIDLRGNRGGTPFYSADLANYFVGEPFNLFRNIYVKAESYRDFHKKLKQYGNTLSEDHLIYLTGLNKHFERNGKCKNSFKGNIVVLIDSGVGSAATMFLSRIEHMNNVEIKGEETHGANNYTTGAEWQKFTLKNSMCTISIPLIIFNHEKTSKIHSGIKAK